MILFEPHCSITKFNKKKCLVFHASSTVIPSLLKGDLISIPHFSSVSLKVTILSMLAPEYVFSLDSNNPSSSTLTSTPFLLISFTSSLPLVHLQRHIEEHLLWRLNRGLTFNYLKAPLSSFQFLQNLKRLREFPLFKPTIACVLSASQFLCLLDLFLGYC